tara:strand:+ start:11177 stop:13825 length:2649 start_codon:yes stop_codon:yes gene_type:complete
MKEDIKKHLLGKDGFIWWIGQIAKQSTWEKNKPPSPVDSNEDEEYKGFGERYRVRIQGYHPTLDCEAVPDEELPFAYVMYPPTAGGGGRGSFQSANLVQGNFVFGWFIDGEDAQIPIIMGVLGYNDYQAVAKQTEGCVNQTPISGYDQEQEGNEVPSYSVREGSGGKVEQQENAKGQPNNDLVTESAQGSNSQKEMASKENNERGKEEEALAKPEDCEPMPTSKIQKDLQNVIYEVERVQRSVYDIREAISMGSADIEGKINGLKGKANQLMASQMKVIFTQIEKTVLEQINTAVKPIHNLLHPNEQPLLREVMDEANELIACIFKNIMSELEGSVSDWLDDVLSGSVINVPDCYINGVVGSMIGSQLNTLTSEVNSVLADVDGLLSSISVIAEAAGSVGGILGAIGSIPGIDLSIIDDAFSFLLCEEDVSCPTTDRWSLWYGTETTESADIEQIMSSASNMFDGSGSSATDGGFDDVEFGSSFECDGSDDETTGPIECGPPVAKIRDGHGAKINFVINPAGKIMAADVVSYGVNYSEFDSDIKVKDRCGIGHGGEVDPIIDDVQVCDNKDGTLTLTYGDNTSVIEGESFENGDIGYFDKKGRLKPIYDKEGDPIKDCGYSPSVVDTVIVSPGLDYLPSPDGSKGGDDRVWARPDDTVIVNPDGSYQPPTPPGVTIPVEPGDTVTTPPTSPPVITEPIPGTPTPTPTPGGGTDPDIPGTPVPTTPDEEEEVGEGDVIIPGVETPITVPARITTPLPSFEARAQSVYPSDSNQSYPVILYLCEIIVKNAGFNYQLGDEVVIKPNMGATAEPKFDSVGRVVSIKVTAGGEGFTQIPYIYIKSQTGYNAKLTPKFCIDRISNDKMAEPDYQDKIITVIDCVGKVT